MEAMNRLILRAKTHMFSMRRLLRDQSGAALLEFTLVVVLLLVVTFGILEAGLISWQWNRAEKATHLGVRYAVESDPVATSFAIYNAVSEPARGPGDPVDDIAEFAVTCTNVVCALSDGALPGGFDATDHDRAAFAAIFTRVQTVFPEASASNLIIEYRHVGFGFASRPGPDLIPTVTVSLQNMFYDVKLMQPFGLGEQIAMGDFAATLTGEDLDSSWP